MTVSTSQRYKSVDEFRGFAIIAMIIVNFLATYLAIPPFLKHAKGIGLTVADLVAPFFLVTIGLLYKKSFLKRVSLKGRIPTYLHMATRYLLITVIGVIGVCVARGRLTTEWGVLQSIGVAGLIVLPLVELDFWVQIAVALSAVIFYQFVLFPFVHQIIVNSKHGGIIASLSWASMLLLGVAAGYFFDLKNLFQTIKRLLIFALITLILGALSIFVVPISKNEVNLSYILVSTSLSVLVFILFLIINEKLGLSIPTLRSLGRNALVLYILHYLLIRRVHFLIPENSGLGLIILGALTVYGFCFGVAWYLDYKKLYLKL